MSEALYTWDKMDKEFKKLHLRISGLENAIAELRLSKEYNFKKLSDELTEEVCELVEKNERNERRINNLEKARHTGVVE